MPQEEILLSEAAAERLAASDGDELSVSGADAALPIDEAPAVTVSGVEPAGAEGENEAPIALVHLSELQTVSGAADGELADRVLVWGEAGTAETAGETAYPDAEIDSPDSVALGSLFDDGLALATSVLALVASIAICASFVATTMGMTVDEDRQTLAVLESVGFPTLSRLAVVALSTLATTAVGALIGVGLGVGAIHVVNAVASATIAPGAVAAVHPLFIPYGIGVALLAGLVAVPYPLAVASRTSVVEEVSQ